MYICTKNIKYMCRMRSSNKEKEKRKRNHLQVPCSMPCNSFVYWLTERQLWVTVAVECQTPETRNRITGSINYYYPV